MGRIACQKDPTLRVPIGHYAAARPMADRKQFDLHSAAYGAMNYRNWIGPLGHAVAAAVKYEQAPQCVGRVDDTQIRPQTIPIDRKKECTRLFATFFQEIGRAKEETQRMSERLSIESDAEDLAHDAPGAITPHEVIGLNALALAALQIDYLGRHVPRRGVKPVQAHAIAQSDVIKGTGEALQDGVEPHLRAD